MMGLQEKLEKEKKQVDRPRFAVELDGLNCFETVVAHQSFSSDAVDGVLSIEYSLI